MRQLVQIMILSAALMIPMYSQAHHSFAAEYDSNNYITLQAKITEIRFRNPHVRILLDVDGDGELTWWNVAKSAAA